MEIPEKVFKQYIRDEWMGAIIAGLNEQSTDVDPSKMLNEWDTTVDMLWAVADRGTYVEINISQELFTEMGDAANVLAQLDLTRFKMMAIKVDGETVMELGEMLHSDQSSPTEEDVERLQAEGDDFHKVFAKATVKLMRRHGMAQGQQLKRAGGPLGNVFAVVLEEVIKDEIDDACDDFRKSLLAEVTVDRIVAWGPPTTPPQERG